MKFKYDSNSPFLSDDPEGMEVHEGYEYDKSSVTVIASIPSPSRSLISVTDPQHYKPGDQIVIDVMKGSEAMWDREVERIKMVRMRLLTLTNRLRSMGPVHPDKRKVVAEINDLQLSLVNKALSYEYAKVWQKDGSVLLFDRTISGEPVPGGVVARVPAEKTSYIHADLANSKEWDERLEIEEEHQEKYGDLLWI